MVTLTSSQKQLLKKLSSRSVIIASLILLIGIPQLSAQDEQQEKVPVRDPFESALLIESQTMIIPSAGTLEFDMIHRFGTVENGMKDLLGVYAPGSNIRLGFTYSLLDDLALGVGFTKLNKFIDFSLKYSFFKQTRDWSMPVSMTYYGNLAIDGRDKELFTVSEHVLVHRMSSFNQVIIGTRFNKNLSIQVAPSFSYFNKVESGMDNYIFGLSAGGRYKLSSQTSFIFDFNQQLNNHTDIEVTPSLGLGLEISTSTHAFQVFVSNFKGILPQYNMVFNENDFSSSGFLIGFNITRLWNL